MGAKFKSKTHLLNMFFWFLAPFFARLDSKVKKSTNMTFNKIFFWKNKKGIKNAEFHYDFKTIEKVFKKFTKSYKQNKFDEHE